MPTNSYPRAVRAGEWTAVLVSPARLSAIRFRDTEVLRALYVAVRDHAWLTVPGVVTPLDASFTADSFRVSFTAVHQQGELDFAWRGIVTGSADGRIRFDLDGNARSSFQANRIGFVALHSLEWSGRPCTLLHTDGTRSQARYPTEVSPHQPFLNLAGIRQQLDSGTWVDLSFHGDVFETEDQRNWSDASFKTYSRPLALPFPVTFDEGQHLRQHVTLAAETAGATARRRDDTRQASTGWASTGVGPSRARRDTAHAGTIPAVRFDPRTDFPWPAIGVGIAPGSDPADARDDLAALGPSHLRVDVALSEHGLVGADDLHRVAALGIPIELAVHCAAARPHDAGELGRQMRQTGAVVCAVLVYDSTRATTSPEALALVRKVLAGTANDAAVAVGTDDYFAELNRNRVRPAAMGADLLTFCLTPQIHDSGSQAILETAEAIPAMVATAQGFGGGAPVMVSPLTLKPRRNIHAEGAVIDRLGRDGGSTDERQSTPFAAAWLVTTLAALSQSGVARITVAELAGARGLVPAGRHTEHERYPIFTVLAAMRGARRGIRHFVDTPGQVDAVGVRLAHGIRVVAANLTPHDQPVRIEGLGAARRIDLAPYAVHTIEMPDPEPRAARP